MNRLRLLLSLHLLSLTLIPLLLSCTPTSTTPSPTPLPASQTTRHTLESEAMDATVPFLVYLPAGYTPTQKYPVWYAMHGYSSTEKWWLNDAHADERADALIASGDLEPMIMVFPMNDMTTQRPLRRTWWTAFADPAGWSVSSARS